MSFKEEKNLALFIDGANFFVTYQQVNLQVDFSKLLKFFSRKLFRAYYYTGMLPRDENSDLRPMIDWLDYNGFTLVTKTTKVFTNSDGVSRVKGNMDIEIAMDMVDLALAGITEMVLFSGDGDFVPVVKWVQRHGVHVTVVSTLMSKDGTGKSSPMIADELRRTVDKFIDIGDNPELPNELREAIRRAPRQ